MIILSDNSNEMIQIDTNYNDAIEEVILKISLYLVFALTIF